MNCIARREVKQSCAGPEFQDTRTITLVLLNSLELYKKQVADPFTSSIQVFEVAINKDQ